MKYYISSLIFFMFFTLSRNYGQDPVVEKGLQYVTDEAIKAQMGFLASDWMEGREAGEKGEYLASDYIASMLRLFGIKPAGDLLNEDGHGSLVENNERSYFQNFILLKTVPGDEQVLKIISTEGKTAKTTNLTYNVDFTFRPTESGVEIEAPVIFAGYGYINDTLKYNDFTKLDPRGRFILKIAGFPRFICETSDRQKNASLSGQMETRYMTMGIAGILEFDPQTEVVGKPDRKDFMNMSPSEAALLHGKPHVIYSIPGKKNSNNFPRIVISAKTANEILNGTGINYDEYISKADNNEKIRIPELRGKSIYLRSSVHTTQVAVRNILGLVEGKNADRVIVVGAHYDHIGTSDGYIWNGADDNASGTVGVMTLARAVMATGKKPENSIVFAFWTAEEEGRLGSKYFIRNPGCPIQNLKLNMNLDMISRYVSDDEPKKVTMTYTSSFAWFREMTAGNLEKYRIDLLVDYLPSSDPPGATDHRSFVEAGIPVIRFKPGHREEYHTPMDEAGTIDWDIMGKIIKICFADTWELANSKW